MSSILEKCHTFKFSESYGFADKVRKAIFERDYAIDPLEVAEDVELQVTKPQKELYCMITLSMLWLTISISTLEVAAGNLRMFYQYFQCLNHIKSNTKS